MPRYRPSSCLARLVGAASAPCPASAAARSSNVRQSDFIQHLHRGSGKEENLSGSVCPAQPRVCELSDSIAAADKSCPPTWRSGAMTRLISTRAALRFLPEATLIIGYARSKLTAEELHQRIKPYLKGDDRVVEDFLSSISYVQGGHLCSDVSCLYGFIANMTSDAAFRS